MSLPTSVLLGSQTPRWQHVPSGGVSSAAAEAIELSAYAGLPLLDWQAWCLTQSMQQRADGLWVSLECYIEVPRQNGKGGILEARQLAGLFLLNSELQIHTAHEFKTAYEHFRRLVDLVEGRDDLRRRVKRVRTGAGDQAIEMLNGNRIRFMARTGASGRGFSCDDLYLDEAQHLTHQMVGAVMPSLSARPNPQVMLTGSAPLPTSEVVHNMRRRIEEADEPRLFGAVWGNTDDVDIDERDALIGSNPSLGALIDVEFAESERRAMSPEEYRRERLGVAEMPVDTKADIKVTLEAWAQCAEPPEAWSTAKVAEGSPIVLAVSAPADRSTASVVMAGYRSDGLVHIEELGFDSDGRRLTGVSWLKEALPRMVRAWGEGLVEIAVDPKDPAASVVAEVEAELGQKVTRVSLERFAASCVDLVDKVHEQTVRHRGEFVFSESVAGLRVRQVGDAGLWVWDRLRSKSDASPLVAVSLAVGALPAAVAKRSQPAAEFFAY